MGTIYKGHIDMLEKVRKRATKLIAPFKKIWYVSIVLNYLPTLHYRQVKRDMIEMYKILFEKYDTAVSPRVTREHRYITRGNDLRLEKSRPKYDFANTFFTKRVLNIWNSLPNDVVLCDTVN